MGLIDDLKDCNYYIVTVPTPVDKNNRPYDANNIILDPNACARNANGQFL